MKYKKLNLIAILLLGFGQIGLQAQTMHVSQNDGTLDSYALSNIYKMSFSSGNLIVTETDNSSSIYALSDLRYLNFSEIVASVDESIAVQSQMLSAYPNPTSDILNIDLTGLAHEKGNLSILNFEGKTFVSRQVINLDPLELSLDLSHLPKGIYICQYSSATEVKTVKIIKQ